MRLSRRSLLALGAIMIAACTPRPPAPSKSSERGETLVFPTVTPAARPVPIPATPEPTPTPEVFEPVEVPERPALALYYPWFDQNTWQAGITASLPAERYLSGDPRTIHRHV